MKVSRFRFLWIAPLTLVSTLSLRAADETAAQHQLREDRERFQREIHRQAADAQIRDDRARIDAGQQRTAQELERLRSRQDRQAAEARRLSESVRAVETAPGVIPAPRLAASLADVPSAPPVASSPMLTPDFSVTVLADGHCVIYVKDRPPEVRSAADTEKLLGELLRARKPPR